MSLDWKQVPVAFTQGLDTRTQKKLVVQGRWRQLFNVTLSAHGTPQRRDGWTSLVATAGGNGLALHGSQLLVVAGGAVSTVITANKPDTVSQVSGELGHVTVAKTEVRRSTGLVDSLDCAAGGGFTLYAWRDSSYAATGTLTQNGLNITLVDEASGAQLISNHAVTSTVSAFCPRVVFSVDCFYVFWIDGQNLKGCTIRTTSPSTVNGPVNLVSSANLADINFDACSFGGSTPGGVMVVYGWTDGVTSLRSINVARNPTNPAVIQGPTNLIAQATVPVANITCMCCTPIDDGILGSAFVQNSAGGAGAGVYGVTIASAWTVATAATNIDAVTAISVGNSHITAIEHPEGVTVFYDQRGAAADGLTAITRTTVSNVLGNVDGPTAWMPSARRLSNTSVASPSGPYIAGKAFSTNIDDAHIYLPVEVIENYFSLAATTANNNAQNTFFVADGSTSAGVVVAKALYGTYGAPAGPNGNLAPVCTPCSTPNVGTGIFAIAVPELGGDPFFNGFNASLSGVARLTLTPVLGPLSTVFTGPTARSPSRVELGGSTYFAGGSLTAYDGVGLVEHGFPLFPEGIKVTPANAGGTIVDGTYQVVAIYEWVDNAGDRHQSAPSLPVSFTIASGGANTGQATINMPTLLLSQKAGVQLALFVTQNGGITFTRWTAISSPIPNITSAHFTTIVKTADPALSAGNELLYHQPAVPSTLANDAPGPCNFVNVHQSRLWTDVADDRFRYRFSQEYVPGLGLQFNEDLGGVVPSDSGGLVGAASMDEKQILFTSRKLFAVFGSGPDPTGDHNGYQEPQEIPSDVGCSDPRSILRTPQGVIFKSLKGWYLLSRDLQVQYIGDGVQQYDGLNITSAVLLEDRRECRFTLESDGDQPVSLVFSYLQGQWSVFDQFFTGYPVADAIWWPAIERYVHVSNLFGLNQDVPGTVVDQPGQTSPGHGIAVRMQTGWLRLGALEGFQRVRWGYLTASSQDAAVPTTSLIVAVDYDDGDAAVAPGAYSFVVDFSTIGFTLGMPVDIRFKLRRQKCKSISFTFTEINEPTSKTPLLGLEALTLELGMKRGTNKLSAAQSVG